MDLLSIIKNVAPMIAGTVLGPFGGMAANALLSIVPDAHKAAAQAALQEGPESFLQHIGDLFQQGVINTADIKKAEMAHAERMAELGYKNVADLAKIDADDRMSARQREMTVKDETPKNLAYLIITGFFVFSGAMIYGFIWQSAAMGQIPSQGWVVIGSVYGYLAAEAKQAAAYYFGSSSGSKEKDATLADIAKA